MNNYPVPRAALCETLPPMLNLTRHEQKVLLAVLLLLFIGLTVKVIRTAKLADTPAPAAGAAR